MSVAAANVPNHNRTGQRGGKGRWSAKCLYKAIVSGSRGSSLMAASISSAVIGEGSTPVSFLNSLGNPGSLNARVMASRKMLTGSWP